MNVGPYIFGALAFGFVVLLFLVIRKMAAKGAPSGEEGKDGAPGKKTRQTAADGEEAAATPSAKKSPPSSAARPAQVEEQGLAVSAEAPAGPDHEEEKLRLTRGLAKTRGGFIAKLGSLFKKKGLDSRR